MVFINTDVLAEARDHLAVKGFAVVPAAFDPAQIAAEVDWAIATGCAAGFQVATPDLTVTASYVPMTTAETPVSLRLLLKGAVIAEQLLQRSAAPFRAKGTVYSQNTSWHQDSDLDISAVSILAYLDVLDADTGALRVVPGSHRWATDILPLGWELQAQALTTRPGDLIIMNERTRHAAYGGNTRRQWRADYVAIPHTSSEEAVLRSYVASNFCPGWDGGYNVDRFPTYGLRLLELLDPTALATLERSGALAAAQSEEDHVRASRRLG